MNYLKKNLPHVFVLFLCFLLFFFLSSCRLQLANYARDEVFPEDLPTRLALSPLLLPSYVVLSVTDVVLINPIRGSRNVPETVEDLWTWENENPWVGLGLLLPVKAAATPVWVIGTTAFTEQFTEKRKDSF